MYCHTVPPYVDSVTTTPNTCWQSGRSLAASLSCQYHKTDTGMICALNGLLTLSNLYIIHTQTWSTVVYTVLDMETTSTKIYDRKYLPLNQSSWNLKIYRSIVKVLFMLDTGPFRIFCLRWTARSWEIQKVYNCFPYMHNSCWNLWQIYMYSIFCLIRPLPVNYWDFPLCLKTRTVK